MQLVGGGLALLVIRVLYPDITPAEAAEAIVPHDNIDKQSALAPRTDGAPA